MTRHLPRGDRFLFKIGEIRELIRLLDETSVSELTVESGDSKLQIKKPDLGVAAAPAPAVAANPPVIQQAAPMVTQAPPAAAPEPAKEEDDASVAMITSPMVGTFYRAPSPDAPPYVEEGSKVNAKTVVCIVEAMKLMNEIEAEVSGTVVEVLAENGQLVEYGQPLFKIKRA